MRVRFWGTRGSIPVALTVDGVRRKLIAALRGAAGRTFRDDAELEAYVDGLAFADGATFGGHTSCVEIENGGPDFVICDLGTGVRPFGQSALARNGGGGRTYHVFLSHVHWDHIMGLPFFTPAYIPGNRVVVYGGHAHLEAALRRQQEQPSFPVDFSTFRADISFVRLEPGRWHDVAGMRVLVKLQRHGGDSYGFRFESGGKACIYSTDSEHDLGNRRETDSFVEFFRGADLVIFDAMYSLADAISVKADWGHSSNIAGVELCHAAGVRHLCMFHHEPAFDDASIARVLADTRRYEEICRTGAPMTVTAAYDGMEIEL
ncbi:MAG TPA: MBL fold metallo-hydrolase [Casimicrobiaceae bacterium]|nr:MBL fold metallo-hydrolase [Casimicrobiaceae bacterium]